MPAIEFSRTHSYLPAGDGISLPVFLNNGSERVRLLAHVDTGASHCLFERRHGELLNLDVEAGDPMAFRTATGRVGWLDRIRLGLIDHDGLLYVASYDQAYIPRDTYPSAAAA